MDIVLLQGANGPRVEGPRVRVPIGNYRIEKSGYHNYCRMTIDNSTPLDINSRIILSSHSTIKLEAKDAKNLTVKFIKEE